MTTHAPDVAAVLDKLRDELCHGYLPGPCCCDEVDARRLIDTVIDAVRPALSAAGYAVVKLPEGVEVEHGARLVRRVTYDDGRTLYAIEATP